MVTLSNTFTLPSSQSGSISSLSAICSFTNADNELAFTVSVISEPYPSFLSASYNSALFSLTADAYSLVQRYFYVVENKIFTPEEKEYILNSSDRVLTDLMQAWYDYGDWSDRVSDSVDNTFNERIGEHQKSLDNSED